MNALVTIIIVCYNSGKELINCIRSAENSITGAFYRIILVENGVIDSENLKIDFAKESLSVLSPKENLGFGSANNLAIRSSESEYLLFCNPDIVLTEDCVSPIIEFMKSFHSIGACAPRLVYEDGKYQNSTGFKMGLLYEFLEAYFLIGLMRKILNRKYKKQHPVSPVRVGWVSGAFMIVKREAFEKVSGFDEDYFLNYEDIDLCRRLEKKGFQNYYFPDLKCTHLDHKSFDKNYELLVFSRYESRLKYAGKHYGTITRLLVRFMHIEGLILRILVSSILYKSEERKSRLLGYKKSLKLYFGMQF